jgi:tellurite methyltransferase
MLADESVSARQRWDERYATFSSKSRLEPTLFVTACLPKLPTRGWALDVAAGAGRHAIALAQRGLRVDAVDISCRGLGLARQRAMAVNLISGKHIRLIALDIERPWLPYRRYDVILVSFFLYRPLFRLIRARLVPGGWLVYESYTTDQVHTSGGRPLRRDFLLEQNELRDAFSDYEILYYDEGNHNDKATAQLLARKRM